jgi:hypothetical protein
VHLQLRGKCFEIRAKPYFLPTCKCARNWFLLPGYKFTCNWDRNALKYMINIFPRFATVVASAICCPLQVDFAAEIEMLWKSVLHPNLCSRPHLQVWSQLGFCCQVPSGLCNWERNNLKYVLNPNFHCSPHLQVWLQLFLLPSCKYSCNWERNDLKSMLYPKFFQLASVVTNWFLLPSCKWTCN